MTFCNDVLIIDETIYIESNASIGLSIMSMTVKMAQSTDEKVIALQE